MLTKRIAMFFAAGAASAILIFQATLVQANPSEDIPCNSEDLCTFLLTDPSKYADFKVPLGVNELTIEVIGASGGSSDNGSGSSPVGVVTGQLKVEGGNIVRFSVGGAGKPSSLGGLGGTNPAGGFAGGAGGLNETGIASGGGGGAASVIFYLDQVIVAGGGGGGNGTTAGGGGGGGERGGQGGLVSQATTEFAVSGVTRALNLSAATQQIPDNTNGSIKVSYQVTKSIHTSRFDPKDPLSNPVEVANFAVGAIAALGSIASLWVSPRQESDDIGSISNVDLNDVSGPSALKPGWGDRLKMWRSSYWVSADRDNYKKIQRWAKVSKLVTRLHIDGAYLRSIFGALAANLKVLSLLIGFVLGFSATDPFNLNSTALIILLVIGVLDALAGAFGFIGLITILFLQYGSLDPTVIQYFGGLALLGFAPILAGAAFRDFRRNADQGIEHIWNRVADAFLTIFFVLWIHRNLIDALPVLARQEVNVYSNPETIAISLGLAFLTRLLLEELSARFYPIRLKNDHPDNLPEQTVPFATLAMLFRTFVFFLVSFSFIGMCWQLLMGTALFALPQLLNIADFRFKISGLVKNLIPFGLPGFVFTLVLGLAVAEILGALLGESRDFAKNVFALTPIPMTLFAIVKNFSVADSNNKNPFEVLTQKKLIHFLIAISLFFAALKLTNFI